MSYYKIFLNPGFIYLTDDAATVPESDTVGIRIENNTNEQISRDVLLKQTAGKTAIVFSKHLPSLFENFKSSFTWIGAAGGVVFNEKEEILLIHRRGFWDLPKGKIDAGESPEQAAVREVQEETGLKNLVIVKKIMLFNDFQDGTLHIYPLKKGVALKLTHWYVMKTTDEILNPQTEEDIDEARWVKRDDLQNYYPEMYGNLVELLEGLKGLRV